jgi:hypothetical protein
MLLEPSRPYALRTLGQLLLIKSDAPAAQSAGRRNSGTVGRSGRGDQQCATAYVLQQATRATADFEAIGHELINPSVGPAPSASPP